ncbi:MAG: VWA domain-containing protein [Clostridia bacterium]|nr:VWA domain-containing protein [Clostridia bacterium]
MLKRLISLTLCGLMVAGSALAQGSWLTGFDQPQAVDHATGQTVYQAADEAGTVVNVSQPAQATQEEMITYSYTPLDVVLVLDASGSMAAENARTGKNVLSYAQDAAIAFAQTLYAINPASRVGVAQYDDAAAQVIGLTGIGDEAALRQAVRGIRTGGSTNTGGGYAQAVQMLTSQGDAGRTRVVLMLSDGWANVGGSDPVAYAVQQGEKAAELGRVYTIGLVGAALGDTDRAYTRQVLSAGYETQYYEVAFDQVGDIALELAEVFTSIAVSCTADESVSAYQMRVDGAMDVRVQDGTGLYLSSAAEDDSLSAPFGSLSILGDQMDEKLLVLVDGDYRIALHGSHTGTGSYSLTRISGASAEKTVISQGSVETHPALYQVMELSGEAVQIRDESYDPLDITAIDPFTGEPTRGLQVAAQGTLKQKTKVAAANAAKAESLDTLAKGAAVYVLARDEATGHYLTAYTTDEGEASRGWISEKSLQVSGYVPRMVWLQGQWQAAGDTQALRAPHQSAAKAMEIPAGETVELRHVERDRTGMEWAYVAYEKSLVYLPADQLAGWQPLAPENFSLGYGEPLVLWEQEIGKNNFTEIMWAIPQKDGTGVVFSGRTTSSKKPFKKTQGDRDAFVIQMDARGTIESTVMAGGSAMDSYHCIVPAAEGYYISGVTRSNDKDFKNIWDADFRKGGSKATTKRTNALIGHLKEDFSIDWLKSFGGGDQPYGFDMVVELSDGNIAGAGWMYSSSNGVLKSNGGQDFFVVKLSPQGEVLAFANFGDSLNDVPDSAAPTADGGLIMVGMTSKGSHSDGNILVLDKALNLVNQCTYGGSGQDVFDNIRPLADGTFLVTGFTASPSGDRVGDSRGGQDFWAMNIDRMGRCIWSKRYGGSGDEELRGTVILKNGHCLLLGSTTSQDGDVKNSRATAKASDAWALCIDDTGRILWQVCTGTDGADYFNTACEDPQDGGFVLAGVCWRKSDKNARGYAVKLY